VHHSKMGLLMSWMGPNSDSLLGGRTSGSASCGHAAALALGSYVPILLKKSLMISGSSDSVAVMRFAVEAGDDGAARSRSRAAVLFILS
jgi:hypothetical protein